MMMIVIFRLDYVLRTLIDLMKENGLSLAKARSRRFSTQTITDADYVDDIALLANSSALAESLLHSLQKAAGGMVLHIKANKTEYMCFNQYPTKDISTLSINSLKLVIKSTYLGSSVSSPGNDINTQLAKAWLTIDQLSVIWKSDQSDRIKCNCFQAAVMSIHGNTTWTPIAQESYEPYWTDPRINNQ